MTTRLCGTEHTINMREITWARGVWGKGQDTGACVFVGGVIFIGPLNLLLSSVKLFMATMATMATPLS